VMGEVSRGLRAEDAGRLIKSAGYAEGRALMADVLHDERNVGQSDLGAQEVIVVILKLPIRKMVPPTTIKHTQSARGRRQDEQHYEKTYVLTSPYNSAGDFTICRPSLQRLHLNVSCVSLRVSSRNWKSCRRVLSEKWRSTSSFSSTTADESACFEAWRWKIFSSIVPRETKR
jgi:hypothetical protein